MNHVAKNTTGFTLIELLLAMAFISALLLAVATTIIQVGAIYNRGTTMKEVNQASRDISDDIRRNITSAGGLSLDTDLVQSPLTGNPAGGRLCLGKYSYIWNYAKALSSGNPNVTKYETGPSLPTDSIQLVRVSDPNKIYCQIASSGTALRYTSVRAIDAPKAQELLKQGDHSLGIHKFSLATPPASAMDNATNQQLYSIFFTVGTSNINALNDTQSACLPPNNPNSDPLYCTVQTSQLVVRAGK